MRTDRNLTWISRVLAVIVLTVLSVMITACAYGGQNGSPDETGDMKIDITEDGTIRNGTEYKTYLVEEGHTGTVSVVISKKSGRLDMDVYRVGHEDFPDYTGRDLEIESFTVNLKEPGEYKVRITARDFVGDYLISWKTKEQEKN
ncbi:MAG: hypothetical protein ACI4S9_03290 [Christensenellales bacterium]